MSKQAITLKTKCIKLTSISISIRKVNREVGADLKKHAEDTRSILFGILGQNVEDVLTPVSVMYVCILCEVCASMCVCVCVCV